MSGRYVAVELGWYRSHREKKTWGVEDLSLNVPNNLLWDWSDKGVHRRVWRGTKAEAVELARKCNDRHPDVDFVTKGELSVSMLRHYAKIGQRRRSERTRSPRSDAVPRERREVSSLPKRTGRSGSNPDGVPFKRCHCGAMYKGAVHCV